MTQSQEAAAAEVGAVSETDQEEAEAKEAKEEFQPAPAVAVPVSAALPHLDLMQEVLRLPGYQGPH